MGSNVRIHSHLGLSTGKACVWFTDVTSVIDPDCLAQYESMLNEEERRRHRAFHFDDDRHLYLVAHALLRTSLSRYACVAPQHWQFSSEDGQRPEILHNRGQESQLRFSLSHTAGLAACVIALDADVGIDVEKVDREVNAMTISAQYFSSYEAQQVAALSGDARQERFLEYWTLKEAYLKACGVGLSIPMNDFYFERDGSEAWQIKFSPGANSPTDAWQFWSARPTPHHIMSIAIRRADQRPFDVTIRETVPLCGPTNSPDGRCNDN